MGRSRRINTRKKQQQHSCVRDTTKRPPKKSNSQRLPPVNSFCSRSYACRSINPDWFSGGKTPNIGPISSFCLNVCLNVYFGVRVILLQHRITQTNSTWKQIHRLRSKIPADEPRALLKNPLHNPFYWENTVCRNSLISLYLVCLKSKLNITHKNHKQ